MKEFHTLILGAGIAGIALARELARRGKKGIAVLDKESEVAFHTSSRNSGVLHAGYNPKPGTLKAGLCVEGNKKLKAFCKWRGVPLWEGGILVVAQQEKEIPILEELLRRGKENGAPDLRLLNQKEIAGIEPNARGLAALHAPSGASVHPKALVQALAEEAQSLGAKLLLGSPVQDIQPKNGKYLLRTPQDTFLCSFFINCAGLYADRIAHHMGLAREYSILPVRGEYRLLNPEKKDLIRSMVYPVPDPRFPFLGVHWTKSPHGEVKIGPNAVPALGREAYSWGGSCLPESLRDTLRLRTFKLLARPPIAKLFAGQIRNSLFPKAFIREALKLVAGARPSDFIPGPSGIRAQVIDSQGRLIDDLLTVEGENCLHLLNLVSPGLTCALPLAEHLADTFGL
ncbi:MAG: L-2-hydroxyglutarate oxidase [Elusimicrobia bacterium]|nr:L-2-hydroxyglutarate oxidase [Elusimicrobiota bacterium]